MAASTLTIKDLHVEIEGKEILKGVNLEIKGGEFHAVMGPNGTGKSARSGGSFPCDAVPKRNQRCDKC